MAATLASVVLMTTLTGAGSVQAASVAKAPIAVLVNYQKVEFSGQEPYISKGSTMVPVRGVFENMAASVSYTKHSTGQIEVTAKHFDDTVKMTVGSKTAFRNGQLVQLDRAAENVNGRVAVPLRFISEAFGGSVSWVPKSKSKNSFDYIKIDGQFLYPNQVQSAEMSYHESGYGTPAPVKSFPIIIKHPDRIITIKNITNSLYVYNKPNDSHLYAKASKNNDPNWNALGSLGKGILRMDVEIEALTDNVSIDELNLGTYKFSAISKLSGDPIVTAMPFQLKNTPLNPDQFDNFLPTKVLKKGEKIDGTLPFEIYSANSKQNFEIDISSSNTLSYSLTIPAYLGGK